MSSATLDRGAPEARESADALVDPLRGTPPGRRDVLAASAVSAIVLVVVYVSFVMSEP